jgi:hypothetical protein
MSKGKKANPTVALSEELSALRALVEETARQCELNMKARIDELLHVLESPGRTGDSAVLQKLADRVKRVREKPQKGRAKDLKRIHDVLDDLDGRILDGPA